MSRTSRPTRLTRLLLGPPKLWLHVTSDTSVTPTPTRRLKSPPSALAAGWLTQGSSLRPVQPGPRPTAHSPQLAGNTPASPRSRPPPLAFPSPRVLPVSHPHQLSHHPDSHGLVPQTCGTFCDRDPCPVTLGLSLRGPPRPAPAQVFADVLQEHGQQQDLEGERGQVVVEEQCLPHQEEGKVVHRPAAGTQGPGQHPAQPGVCGDVDLSPRCRLGTDPTRLRPDTLAHSPAPSHTTGSQLSSPPPAPAPTFPPRLEEKQTVEEPAASCWVLTAPPPRRTAPGGPSPASSC